MSNECFWGNKGDVLISKEQFKYFEELIKQKDELKKWIEKEINDLEDELRQIDLRLELYVADEDTFETKYLKGQIESLKEVKKKLEGVVDE